MTDGFIIRRCLHDESKEGWVWISDKGGTQINYQKLVKITSKTTRKTVVVAPRKIEERYMRIYNMPDIKYCLDKDKTYLVIGDWYRNRLGIVKPNCKLELEIANVWCLGWFRYLYSHPSDVVRITFYLTVFSITIGLISLLPLLKYLSCVRQIVHHLCN